MHGKGGEDAFSQRQNLTCQRSLSYILFITFLSFFPKILPKGLAKKLTSFQRWFLRSGELETKKACDVAQSFDCSSQEKNWVDSALTSSSFSGPYITGAEKEGKVLETGEWTWKFKWTVQLQVWELVQETDDVWIWIHDATGNSSVKSWCLVLDLVFAGQQINLFGNLWFCQRCKHSFGQQLQENYKLEIIFALALGQLINK